MSKYLEKVLQEIENDFGVSSRDLNITENPSINYCTIDNITYLDLLDSYIDNAINYKAGYGILALREVDLPPLNVELDITLAYNYDKIKFKNILLKAKSANVAIKMI